MILTNTIIYSDTLNETEFLRALAKSGIKTLGVRVMNSYDLSLLIIAKLGKNKQGLYLNNEEQNFVYYNLLKPNCFNDAANIRSAINTFRDTGKGNSFKELDPYLNKSFAIKAAVIKEGFEKYSAYKQSHNAYDLFDLLYELDSNSIKLNTKVIYFDDLPYSPLAISVFSKYFDLQVQKFADLFSSLEINQPEIAKCYGKNNEFAYLVNRINGKIKCDQCLIVLSNPNDAAELMVELDRYAIPYTTSLGIPFAKTDIGRFVAKMQFMKNKEWGIEAYKQLFASSFFDKDKYISKLTTDKERNDFIKYLGWLRPSFDKDPIIIDSSLYSSKSSLIIECAQLVCGVINNQHKMFDFIKNNLVSGSNSFEAEKLLDKYQRYMDEYQIDFDTIVDNLLTSSISQHISTSGAVHICSLSQAFSSLREHIFIVGLDSSFPGNPKENYLIYDEEFLKMDANKFISSEIVKSKKEMMELLINHAKNCYLSYTHFNVIDNKQINPSSIIQELLSKATCLDFNYEDDALSMNNQIIKYFNKGHYSLPNNTHQPYVYDYQLILDKKYKPSSFNSYFKEEYRLGFILQTIFGISIEEEDDPYVVIDAREKGNIFHLAVRNFEKGQIAEQAFVNQGLKIFDQFIAKKPPILQAEAIKARNRFEEGLRYFYQQDPGNKHIYSEYNIDSCNVYGLEFDGSFDRLEKDATNKYILVDYKTSENSNKHKNEDVIDCMQGLIYAEMIEKALKIKVDRCVFRYPFIKSESYITFNQSNRDELKQLIGAFIDDITQGNFSALGSDDKYTDQYKGLVSLIKELKH